MHHAACGKGAPLVVGFLSAGELSKHSIHHHIPGAGIEGKHILQTTIRGQTGDVANAADVLQGNTLGFAAVN